MQNVVYSDEWFSVDGHEVFHLVLLAYYYLMIGESAEEAVLGSFCSPGALDDGLLEIHVAVFDPG